MEILNSCPKILGQNSPGSKFGRFFYLTHWYFLQFYRTLVRSEFPGQPGRTGNFKSSSDPSHFIFELNVGKSRIRHEPNPNMNDVILNRFWVDLEI